MFILAAAALAAAAPGNAPPQRTGECRWVHGRYAVYNGSGIRRIWVIGTRRIVALYDDDENVPSAIARYHERPDPGYGYEDALFGDFYVCALERSRPGHMQHVRLLRTRNLVYRGRPYSSR